MNSNRTSGGISGKVFLPAVVAIVSVTLGAWSGALMANGFAVRTDAFADVQKTETQAETKTPDKLASAVPAAVAEQNGNKDKTIMPEVGLTDKETASPTPGPAGKPWGLAQPSAGGAEPPAPGPKKAVTDPDHGFNDYESWLAMMQSSAVHWNEPTDGQRHPQISMTSGHEVSSPIGQYLKKGEKQVTITISAVIDKEALFEFNGDVISYRPFRSTLPAGASGEGKIYPFEGNYPVNVTVNGMQWQNLRNRFKLDFTPNLKSLGGMELTQGDVTFRCRFSDAYGHDRLVLEIFNRGPTPSPVQIKLTTKAPADGK